LGYGLSPTDYFMLFKEQDRYKNDYTMTISNLLYFLRFSPQLDPTLSFILGCGQNEHEYTRKIDACGVNGVLLQAPEPYLKDLRERVMPSLKYYFQDNLPWENEKSILLEKQEVLIRNMEESLKARKEEFARQRNLLLAEYQERKSALVEAGYSEEEAKAIMQDALYTMEQYTGPAAEEGAAMAGSSE